jgi:tripeptidyl-peptidase-1
MFFNFFSRLSPKRLSNRVAKFFKDSCKNIKINNYRDVLKINSPVKCVEEMFNIKMKAYNHLTHTTSRIIRKEIGTKNVNVPAAIADDIEMISGLTAFPIPRNHKAKPIENFVSNEPGIPDATYGYICPQVVRLTYGIPNDTVVKNTASITQAAIEFIPVAAPEAADFTKFAKLAEEHDETYTTIGPVTRGDDGESTLDVQYLFSLAPSATNYYISIAEGWIYEMAVQLFSMTNPATPQVNSVSYGWPEAGSCQSDITGANCTGIDSQQYVGRSENELAKLASNGISVVVASQDEGAPSEANEGCSLDNTQPVWPIYPSSSAWVTSVSATTIFDSAARRGNTPEVGQAGYPPICNADYPCATGTFQQPCMPNNTYYTWTTGGGFSNYTSRPSWQATDASQYLSSGAILPPTKFFWPNNRVYPDVSAVGSRILIVISGAISVTAGTSASTPIFAAIVTLLNDARVSAGKKPLGFLNQLLYQAPANAFTIINEGNNKCTIGTCCKYGYGNTNGYSAVNGLGTPIFANLLTYALSLP